MKVLTLGKVLIDEDLIVLNLFSFYLLTDFPPCGKRFSATQNVRNKRVVGGRESRPNSWPWQIELRFNVTEHYCGGAIIHPQWVVTAGHCFFRNKDPEKFEVRVGEHDTTRLEGNSIRVTTSSKKCFVDSKFTVKMTCNI